MVLSQCLWIVFHQEVPIRRIGIEANRTMSYEGASLGAMRSSIFWISLNLLVIGVAWSDFQLEEIQDFAAFGKWIVKDLYFRFEGAFRCRRQACWIINQVLNSEIISQGIDLEPEKMNLQVCPVHMNGSTISISKWFGKTSRNILCNLVRTLYYLANSLYPAFWSLE